MHPRLLLAASLLLVSPCARLGADETAPPQAAIRAAVERALPLLVKGGEGHMAKRSCFACHNQALPVLALTAARSRGFAIDSDALRRHDEHIAEFLGTNRDNYRQGRGQGGAADTAGYALWTLHLAGHSSDETTTAVVEYLLKYQGDRDHWRTTSNRPPSEASALTTTYLALNALRVYGTPKQKERIDRRTAQVHAWLASAPTRDTEDRVFRLRALKTAGADPRILGAAARELLRTQRPDGGWAQLDGKDTDAYATGSALVALHDAAGLATDSPIYLRGVAFLLRTQRPDGSWFVHSRSRPFQTYYESGFPHRKDQFISMAASGWATTALVLSLPAVKGEAKVSLQGR